MLVKIDTLEPWRGERIDDKTLPPNIEQLWSKAELNRVGLAKVERSNDTPTAFERQVDTTRDVVDGVVIETPVFEKLPDVDAFAQIKNQARQLILNRFPEWQQANMTARAVVLVDKKRTTELDESEQQEEQALYAAWNWIASIRARSNELEAAYSTGADVDLEAGSIGDEGSWPE